ncbi:MAG: HD domain-containing protein [Patescibacteria group bacterium]
MSLPTRPEAQALLEKHVKDEYQRYHSKMVAVAMEGYAKLYNENRDLWYITGLLHDIDFSEYPDTHPKESLLWFKEWEYPEDLIHAVLAHAFGYNGYTTLPQTKLAAALMACDEISGLFYAYRKLNPIPFKDMKASSIKKRFIEERFAVKIDRATITRGCQALKINIDDHINNLIRFFGELS